MLVGRGLPLIFGFAVAAKKVFRLTRFRPVWLHGWRGMASMPVKTQRTEKVMMISALERFCRALDFYSSPARGAGR